MQSKVEEYIHSLTASYYNFIKEEESNIVEQCLIGIATQVEKKGKTVFEVFGHTIHDIMKDTKTDQGQIIQIEAEYIME